MGVTKTPAGSPSAGDEEIDDVADQATVADPESSTGTDVAATSSVESRDAVGNRDAEKQPTALDALKAKLVKPDPEPEGDEPAAAPETVEEVEEPDVVPAASAADETDETPTETADSDEDPLRGFTEREIKHPSNKGLVTRIRDLAADRKKLTQTVRELEPVRDAGQFLTKFQADNDLTAEESVAALTLSAAFKRGDPKALEALEAATFQLREDLGMPATAIEPPAPIEPFKGALSQEFADMVSALGFSEEDARLCAAFLADRKKPKTAPAAPARPTPRPIAQQRPPTDRAHLDRINAAGNENVLDFLETQKIDRKSAKDYIGTKLLPYLKPLAPNGDISRIAPEDRLRLVTIAQQKHVIAQAKARAAARVKNPQALSSTTSTASPSSTTSKPQSELDKLRARMVAKR